MGLLSMLTGQVDPNQIYDSMMYSQSRNAVNDTANLAAQAQAMGDVGGQYRDTAQGFYGQASSMLDPNSQYNQSVLGMMQDQNRQNTADTLAQQNMLNQRNMAMAGGGASGIMQAQARGATANAANQLNQQNLATRMNWMSGMANRAGQVGNIAAQAGGLGLQANQQQMGLMGMRSNVLANADAQRNQMLANAAQGRTQATISNATNKANFYNALIGGAIGLAATPASAGPTIGGNIGRGIMSFLGGG